jgi:hypothetical protein
VDEADDVVDVGGEPDLGAEQVRLVPVGE